MGIETTIKICYTTPFSLKPKPDKSTCSFISNTTVLSSNKTRQKVISKYYENDLTPWLHNKASYTIGFLFPILSIRNIPCLKIPQRYNKDIRFLNKKKNFSSTVKSAITPALCPFAFTTLLLLINVFEEQAIANSGSTNDAELLRKCCSKS